MQPNVELAARQLARMRGMTGLYHKQFFSDVRYTTLVSIALLGFGFWQVPELFLLLPVVALIGAAQTAFDASYLIFARHYAASLEAYLNDAVGERVLVAAELERDYLFPLDTPKIVTLAFGSNFTWFGFMTALYTGVGVTTYVVGLILGLPVIESAGWSTAYVAVLGSFTAAALAVGLWWFPGGAGERRLRHILDDAFGA